MAHRPLCLLAVVIGLLPDSLAVSAEVTFFTDVNRDTIEWGDPVTFRARTRYGRQDRVEIDPEGEFPGPFEIRDRLPPVVKELDDGRVEETRDYLMKIFESGAFEVPPLTLRYRTASGDTGRIRSLPIPVVVRALEDTLESSEQRIKEQKEVPVKIPRWIWFAGAALVLAAAGAIWYVKWRRRRPREEPPAPPVDWPAEVEKVARMGLLEKGDTKRFYSLLSEVLRRFLEARTGIEAMERTTFEIGRDLHRVSVGEEVVLDLEGFLSEADLVKFAKFRPAEEVAAGAVGRVRGLVERIEAEYRNRSAEGEADRDLAGVAR